MARESIGISGFNKTADLRIGIQLVTRVYNTIFIIRDGTPESIPPNKVAKPCGRLSRLSFGAPDFTYSLTAAQKPGHLQGLGSIEGHGEDHTPAWILGLQSH